MCGFLRLRDGAGAKERDEYPHPVMSSIRSDSARENCNRVTGGCDGREWSFPGVVVRAAPVLFLACFPKDFEDGNRAQIRHKARSVLFRWA
jgi:hypothetical protein